MKQTLGLIALLMLSAASFAADNDQWLLNGKPVKTSDTTKSINGFAAMIQITSDANFPEKWENPKLPTFTSAASVDIGKSIFVLVFFSNPKVNDNKEANIECDFKVTRPNGSISLDRKGISCFKHVVAGDLKNLYMTDENIGFKRDPPDPAGKWLVNVNVIDKNRGTTIPLKTSFMVN